MSTKTFVSPGVYTSEKDLTYVTRQVGVTSLGLVGETLIGPAFQPIFISGYDEFVSFFGGTNPTKVKGSGFPKYELPYIAKSYLSQGNQLFVTRVLGFSGYNAGKAWGIALDAALDLSTTATTTTATYNPLITYTATSAGTNVTLVSSDTLIQDLINDGSLTITLQDLGKTLTGNSISIPTTYYKYGSTFSGVSVDLYVATRDAFTASTVGYYSGTTTGITQYYTGTPYSDVENQIIALLRSRGTISATTQQTVFDVYDEVVMDPAYSGYSKTNPLGVFQLSGLTSTLKPFAYQVSLDSTSTSNYLPNVLGRTVEDGNATLFVEEFFPNMLNNLGTKVRGIKQTIINYSTEFKDYLNEYQSAVTPWVVSELRGNKVLRLFRFITISDGNAANEQFKITITNIKPDSFSFDVLIRPFTDADKRASALETYSNCTMDPTASNYIGRRIGTVDGVYASKSAYVLVELDDSTDSSLAFPAGFIGYPIRDYQSNSNGTVKNPKIAYKKSYETIEIGNGQKNIYLGISDSVGMDADFFDYKGIPDGLSYNTWTGLTAGYHLDYGASAVTLDNVSIVIDNSGTTFSPIFEFETGIEAFRTEAAMASGSQYTKPQYRHFTFVPYGGFDGWNVYDTIRTNSDLFSKNGRLGINGKTSGTFVPRALTNGDTGINSDYYAYLEAIWTFKNPEATNINVFATPGIDSINNQGLVTAAIDMIEEDRADSLYIITTPDIDGAGDTRSTQDIVDSFDGLYDSNYSCTYWPWIKFYDVENTTQIFLPPTSDVVRNIALTDKISYPWFAVAGIQRGDVNGTARKILTLAERDMLYEVRINPIATFTSDGTKIWGNKTLQVKDTALNRINVRRLLLQARKLISAVAVRLLFEQNDAVVRNQFLSLVNPILDNIRSERGLTDFRVVLSNDPEDIDKNQLTGQIFLKPTRALEFIQVEFVIMNTGASFSNV